MTDVVQLACASQQQQQLGTEEEVTEMDTPREAIASLVSEFHLSKKTKYATDEEFDVAFGRREAIKKEIRAVLEALTPEDHNPELEALLEELRKDAYLLLRRPVDDALDLMREVVKIPPALDSSELRRIALEGTREDAAALQQLLDQRGEEVTFVERFTKHLCDVRVGDAEPDQGLFLQALARQDSWQVVGGIEVIAGLRGWVGMDRLFQEEPNVDQTIRERFPKAYERYKWGDPRFVEMTANDLNQLLGDPKILGINAVIKIAKEHFRQACAEGLSVARERRAALQKDWQILTSSSIDEVEEFLARFGKSFETEDDSAVSTGPFQASLTAMRVLMYDSLGRLGVRETDDRPTAIALDAKSDEVFVGTGTSVFVFDRAGELKRELRSLRGRPVRGLELHSSGRLCVVQEQRIRIIDRASDDLIHEIATYSMDDRVQAAWNPSATMLAVYGLGIQIYETETWTCVHEQLRLKEEWRRTPSFCWLSDRSFAATVEVELAEEKTVYTSFTSLDEPDVPTHRPTPLLAMTSTGTHLLAAERGTPLEWLRWESTLRGRSYTPPPSYPLGWYELGGISEPPAWSTDALRQHDFGVIRGVFAVEGGAIVNADAGLFLWSDGEPARLREGAFRFSVDANEIAVIDDKGIELINF